MTTTIAVAGKGGTGKTTFTCMLIKRLLEKKAGYIFAIDGDPSANLNQVLGLELEQTIGDIREETLEQVQSGSYDKSMPKANYFEYQINQSIIEGDYIDLLAMGRPEGPGCYCAANSILRTVIDRLGDDYDYVVIDNEAGMEHISRQTTRHIDHLFIISDPTIRGLTAAERIVELVDELSPQGTRVSNSYFIVNRINGELPATFTERAAANGLNLIGTLPSDPTIAEFDLQGRALIELPETAPVYQAARQMINSTIGI